MNIKEMSGREKSVVLARLMGWEEGVVDENGIFDGYHWKSPNGYMWIAPPNFYSGTNVELAWQVLNWADRYAMEDDENAFYNKWVDFNMEQFTRLPLGEAMRLWLDKILELAIEAGMV